jgi:hypothetical protein
MKFISILFLLTYVFTSTSISISKYSTTASNINDGILKTNNNPKMKFERLVSKSGSLFVRGGIK